MSLEVLYTNCDLPQPCFEKASVTGDLSHIVKESGDVDEQARNDAWLAINDEYLQLTGDSSTSAYASDLNHQAELGGKLVTVGALCQMALDVPVEGVLKHLRELYPEYSFPVDDPEQLAEDIEWVQIKLERDALEYDQVSKKLEEEQGEKKDNPDRVTQATFDRIKFAINDKKGMVYDFTKLTTRQYAILVNDLKNSKPKEQQAA